MKFIESRSRSDLSEKKKKIIEKVIMSIAMNARSSREGSSPMGSGMRFQRTPDRHHLHPNQQKCRTPADFKREVSPFELGESVNLQIASSSAIIDKACVMDISSSDVRNVDEYIQLFLTEYCVIDRACYEDVSEPSVRIMVIEEDEEEEAQRTGRVFTAPMPMAEPEPEPELPTIDESDSQDKKKLRLILALKC